MRLSGSRALALPAPGLLPHRMLFEECCSWMSTPGTQRMENSSDFHYPFAINLPCVNDKSVAIVNCEPVFHRLASDREIAGSGSAAWQPIADRGVTPVWDESFAS